jgi:hypothetical protein
MKSQIKTPQAFVYVAKIPAAKTVKGIVFRHGEAVSVHDPKVIRLLSRLPYMRAAETVQAAPKAAKPVEDDAIPADWRKQHWKRRVAWAKAICGAEVTTPTEANRIIAEHRGEPETMPEPVVMQAEQITQIEA